MESRPSCISDESHQEAGSAPRETNGGTEAERMNGSATRVIGGNVSGYSNARARKLVSWSETEFWSIRGVGFMCRQEERISSTGHQDKLPHPKAVVQPAFTDLPAPFRFSGSGASHRRAQQFLISHKTQLKGRWRNWSKQESLHQK